MCAIPLALGGKKAALGAIVAGVPGAIAAGSGGKFRNKPEDYSSHGPGNEWWRIAQREAGY